MTRFFSVMLAVTLVALAAGAALAYGPRGMMGPGWQGGSMGPGGMGGGCPGMAGPGAPGVTEPGAAITEDKAREIATAYADKYFKGYTLERVLPFEGRFATMYQVELRGPKGDRRVLHVNPWGRVRPFGGPLAATE